MTSSILMEAETSARAGFPVNGACPCGERAACDFPWGAALSFLPFPCLCQATRWAGSVVSLDT